MRRSRSEDVHALRRWIDSLSIDELLEAMEFDFIRDNDGKCHEFELLKQMVDTQAPPPTPIHGRAMGYQPASRLGPNDGKDEEIRRRRDRLQKPRLFKFVELESAGCGRISLQRKGNRRSSTKQRRFDVIARKFTTASGEVLSLGCTRDQRESDEEIMLSTRLHFGENGEVVRCSFVPRIHEGKHALLQRLRIASRGAFLSMSPEMNVQSISFCAAWLDPIEHYFSLSKYIVSRFDVVLWSSFRGGRKKRSRHSFQDTASRLSQDAIKVAWSKAVTRALVSQIFPSDAKLTMVRDGLTWRMLNKHENGRSTTLLSDSIEKLTDSVNLLDLGTTKEEFRHMVVSLMLVEMSSQLEFELLSGLVEEKATANQATHFIKRKKKKKVRGKQQLNLPLLESVEEPTAKENGKEGHVRIIPSAEQTRKHIIALTIIDECIEKVFEKVGFQTEVDECQNRLDQTEGDIASTRQAVIKFTDSGLEGTITQPPILPKEDLICGWPTLTESRTGSLFESTHSDLFSFLGNEKTFANAESQGMQGSGMKTDYFYSSTPIGLTWNSDETFDEFCRVKGHQSREKSIFAELFMKDEHPRTCDERNEASSTAASIASSSDKDEGVNEDDTEAQIDTESHARTEPDAQKLIGRLKAQLSDISVQEKGSVIPAYTATLAIDENIKPHEVLVNVMGNKEIQLETKSPSSTFLSAEASKIRSPQCSPILVSLDDLKKLRERTLSIDCAGIDEKSMKNSRTYSTVVSGSLPSSPTQISASASDTSTPIHSVDDLRIPAFTNEQHSKKKNRILPRYAEALMSNNKAQTPQTLPRPCSLEKSVSDLGLCHLPPNSTVDKFQQDIKSHAHKKDGECARSENAIETHTEDPHWIDSSKPRVAVEVDNITTSKDGSTTISALSKREAEDTALIEERNTFRDMCLTLGAEVAKLKNLLAAQQGGLLYHGMDYTSGPQDVMQNSSYNRACTPAFFNGISRATVNEGAMSDAGVHRSDLDSALSEDGTDPVGSQEVPRRPRAIHVRGISSGGIIAGSDVSFDHQLAINMMSRLSGVSPMTRDPFGSFPVHGIQSRLTKDIVNFLNSTALQLRGQDIRRQAAIERLSRLVTALWPRAQVKIYGSHVTGLSLPSSDLDFIVCLPAVHKNAPAVAPGVLEGRNAINESSQKLLSRKLKGESWIDPRSIKIIDRTVVPVIKVSTKDTRSRMLHLDISFAGPEHHGLEAIDMITEITRELPMVRPLVLVLKQFLVDRSLLTAYTGGLSSYCLFLMVTRYLQEQSTSWGDCGSLLMGFLDFYGNSFDPRATGLSVRRRQYFARTIFARQYPQEPPMWTGSHQPHHVSSPMQSTNGSSRPDFLRRHSLTDRGNVDTKIDATRSVPANFHGANGCDTNRSVLGMRPRYQAPYRHSAHYPPPPGQAHLNTAAHESARPYTFDPLFVEDPLSMGNNVGRNAFRIFQVQRAFSDAHRALLASLEWDTYSTNDLNDHTGDYPLLKCLLQSEDVFYDFDDMPPR